MDKNTPQAAWMGMVRRPEHGKAMATPAPQRQLWGQEVERNHYPSRLVQDHIDGAGWTDWFVGKDTAHLHKSPKIDTRSDTPNDTPILNNNYL